MNVQQIMQSPEVDFTRNLFHYNKRMNVTSIFKEKEESLKADMAEGKILWCVGVLWYGGDFLNLIN